MLEDFLAAVGIFQAGDAIGSAVLRDQFSDWLIAQEIPAEQFNWLGARVGAFICEYLIDAHGAERFVEGKRILRRLPVSQELRVYRDFDPYQTVAGLLRKRQSLKAFLAMLCDERPV